MKELTEFGSRLVTLNTGAPGIRAGMTFTVKDVANGNDGPMLDYIGSDATVDRYNEVIDPKGWQLENFRKNPVIPDCHDYSSIAKILGRAVSVEVKDGRLLDRVLFCTDNPLGNLAYRMGKGGFTPAQSVGFIPLEWNNGKSADQPDRTYTACELLEISIVSVPANPGAVNSLLRSGHLETKRDLKPAYEFLKQFCSDDDSEARTASEAAARNEAGVKLLRSIGEALGLRN